MSAFAGVRIVDFTQGLAGPMAVMLLGDFEADVVKVEPPGGDRLKDHPGYIAWNRNKRLLTLDLANDTDSARALELIACADVALFDHAPGRLKALGLDAATLTERHPGLIHAWMPPFGTGPEWADLPPHHSLLAALTGTAFRQGAYADQPVHLILPLCQYGQAVMGAAAIGAALYERARSGQGQAVVVSGLHGMSEVTGPVRVLAGPSLPRAQPLGASPSYRLYECADGRWLFVGTLFANFYQKLVEVMGLGDRWLAFVADPLLARETLKAEFLTRPRDEWLALFLEHAIPAAPIGSRGDWFAGECVGEGGLRLTLEHPERGPVHMPAPPARLSVTPASVRSLARPLEGDSGWTPREPILRRSSEAGEQPLSGVRVLDLGTVIAGAYAGAVLANLGAEVIKIEPPEADPFRSDGAGFLAYNRGKRGLGLDLKLPAARAVFYQMVRQADVVVDNYRLGVRERLGIDYPVLKEINPRLISCSITAYGRDGSRAPRPGFDPLLQAEGGMMAGQGGAGEPILHTIPVNDVATAGIVAFSVIAALNARERTGEGQEIVTSLMAQSLTFQLGEVTTYEGRPPNDVGDRDCLGVRALHRYYPCADGWIGLVCETEGEARGLAAALGLAIPDATAALAAPRDGPLAAAIERALLALPREAAVDRLRRAGVPAAPAVRALEAYESEWLWGERFFDIWRHPRLGDVVSVRAFADFSRTSSGYSLPTPDLGEHTAEVLQSIGVPPGEIEALFATGAVFGREAVAARPTKSARPGDGGAALATI
ncbi:MAG: CoA transferase [Phenylobacterium sp.]|jgi:crotonobetainyl-CoA:carnitine CoA-transferase CaiB-like acyl-CoA transferase|uniref:CaiB/BaiF CoA transferase family protein n=1 Tax=Phenylobacterium sp. TaxID=1871053 RepID=UPI002A368FBE|nr:CoA transferase [Phenylobacterium sp.]MDX9999503.1 CoA transferase [Phenylobacterium sp.]